MCYVSLSDYCTHSESFSVLHRVRQTPVGPGVAICSILTKKLRGWGGGPRGDVGELPPASGNVGLLPDLSQPLAAVAGLTPAHTRGHNPEV